MSTAIVQQIVQKTPVTILNILLPLLLVGVYVALPAMLATAALGNNPEIRKLTATNFRHNTDRSVQATWDCYTSGPPRIKCQTHKPSVFCPFKRVPGSISCFNSESYPYIIFRSAMQALPFG